MGVRAAQEIVGCVELGGIAFGLGGVIVRLSFFFITFAKIIIARVAFPNETCYLSPTVF